MNCPISVYPDLGERRPSTSHIVRKVVPFGDVNKGSTLQLLVSRNQNLARFQGKDISIQLVDWAKPPPNSPWVKHQQTKSNTSFADVLPNMVIWPICFLNGRTTHPLTHAVWLFDLADGRCSLLLSPSHQELSEVNISLNHHEKTFLGYEILRLWLNYY